MSARSIVMSILGFSSLLLSSLLLFVPESGWNQAAARLALGLIGIGFLLPGLSKQIVSAVGFAGYCNLRIASLLASLGIFWLYVYSNPRQLHALLMPLMIVGFVVTGAAVFPLCRLLRLKHRYSNQR